MQDQLRILVVEDDISVAEVCRDALEDFGAVVSLATTVASAVALADSVHPDAILCDVDLPDGTVDDLRAEIDAASDDSQVPFFVMSGYDLRRWPRQATVAGYFQKPFTLDELRAVIADALESRRVRTGEHLSLPRDAT